jgi:hypothetical protein
MLAHIVSSRSPDEPYTVLVFGDSWGDFGPTWKVIRDAFKRHNVPVIVKSTAIGGTTACLWAKDGAAMAQAARLEFPFHKDGPDFVWYTLGGNDMIFDGQFQRCTKSAPSIDEAEKCTDEATAKVKTCTSKLLDHYWNAFPKSKVMECNYDVPCENQACRGFDQGFLGGYCGSNTTCYNTMATHWVSEYIGSLAKKYPEPRYTAVHVEGASQMAAGIPGASVGVPVLDRSGPCDMMLECVHPIYGSKAADAVGEAFWDLFFSKHVDSSATARASGTSHADVVV